MTDQMAIDFGAAPRPSARRSDPGTSHGAAVIALTRATTHRQLALVALMAAGETGLTDFELSDATGIAQTSIGCRRLDLVRMGLAAPRMVIGPNGLQQDRRPSPSGTPSLVWVCSEYQRADAKGET